MSTLSITVEFKVVHHEITNNVFLIVVIVITSSGYVNIFVFVCGYNSNSSGLLLLFFRLLALQVVIFFVFFIIITVLLIIVIIVGILLEVVTLNVLYSLVELASVVVCGKPHLVVSLKWALALLLERGRPRIRLDSVLGAKVNLSAVVEDKRRVLIEFVEEYTQLLRDVLGLACFHIPSQPHSVREDALGETNRGSKRTVVLDSTVEGVF